MIVVICMLVGVREVSALIAIFSINACMNFFGLMMEKHNQLTEKTDWTAYNYGVFTGLVPWLCIGIYLFDAGSTGNVPDFVYWIFLIIAIFYFYWPSTWCSSTRNGEGGRTICSESMSISS
jgi:hypothetical protein